MTVIAALALAVLSSTTAKAKVDAGRYEPGILPAINFDSDVGVGFGVIAALARFSDNPHHNPYHWRLQLQIFAAGKRDADGKFRIPFQSHYLNFDWAGLFSGKLRITGRGYFRKFSNSAYYGLGSRSTRRTFSDEELEEEVNRRFHNYDRIYPGLFVNGRWNLYEEKGKKGKRRLEVFFGLNGQYSATEVYPGSRLEQDVMLSMTNTPDGETLAELLLGIENHPLFLLTAGLTWDTRDDEFTPSKGGFTELSMRFSPGIAKGLLYGGMHFSTRWFASLFEDHLVIGARGAADLMFGDVPFYELSRYGVLEPKDGTGGGQGVRGILLQRYHGKVKLLLNIEARGMFPSFGVFGQRIRLGVVAFVDTGRVWTDLHSRTLDGVKIDGPFGEFQMGVGGGLRIQWGQTFIIRADSAYSPTDETLGVYVTLGQMF